jgi:hypothetical protein
MRRVLGKIILVIPALFLSECKSFDTDLWKLYDHMMHKAFPDRESPEELLSPKSLSPRRKASAVHIFRILYDEREK